MDRKLAYQLDDIKKSLIENRRQDIDNQFDKFFKLINEEINLTESQIVVLKNLFNYGLKSGINGILDDYDKFL